MGGPRRDCTLRLVAQQPASLAREHWLPFRNMNGIVPAHSARRRRPSCASPPRVPAALAAGSDAARVGGPRGGRSGRRSPQELRQQQLTALQELLVAEVAVVEGTPLQTRARTPLFRAVAARPLSLRSTPSAPSHVAAVEQAVGLLGQSLGDMQAASRAMMLSQPADVQSVSAAVSATDVRADEVSRMAR
ncbi:hypothetical protein TSOC_004947 [Tetrabaena socialis]|uniref:Uncharacterized protein n=1 Tax=Tetrabaena socialis TaxID=47790 RepID=A0A2J8A7P4_9CHLO|nr:hypothetical protein TSOC_004947 [Tetrabaena socialis]|eukprot:PNH08500.1 hypothetical protein TSOC_004947 [Tetrabaena socialis]